MDVNTIVSLVKDRLGIRSTVRDTYITAIVNGIIKELTDEKGITLDNTSYAHIMFCVDYATWHYHSVSKNESASSLPRHLQYRLRNLIISSAGD